MHRRPKWPQYVNLNLTKPNAGGASLTWHALSCLQMATEQDGMALARAAYSTEPPGKSCEDVRPDERPRPQ